VTGSHRMLSNGSTFRFRFHPEWKFWRSASGLGRVISFEPSENVVHVQLIADGLVIGHAPVCREALRSCSAVKIPWDSPEGRALGLAGVSEWRLAHERGEAGAFTLSIREIVAAVRDTLGGESLFERVETTYPTRDATGEYRTVRVVTAPAA
jgi:hypothetical protein